MTEPFVTIRSGGPDIPDGVYPVVLTAISDPRTVTAQRGPKTGQEVDLIDWTFAIDAPGNPYDSLEVNVSSSTASGPKSKMYAFLTALFNGVAPSVGTQLTKDQLIGRQALATIQKDEEGWLRITTLAGIPVSMQQQRFAAATGAPVASPPAVNAVPAQAPVAAAATPPAGDQLPF